MKTRNLKNIIFFNILLDANEIKYKDQSVNIPTDSKQF